MGNVGMPFSNGRFNRVPEGSVEVVCHELVDVDQGTLWIVIWDAPTGTGIEAGNVLLLTEEEGTEAEGLKVDKALSRRHPPVVIFHLLEHRHLNSAAHRPLVS